MIKYIVPNKGGAIKIGSVLEDEQYYIYGNAMFPLDVFQETAFTSWEEARKFSIDQAKKQLTLLEQVQKNALLILQEAEGLPKEAPVCFTCNRFSYEGEFKPQGYCKYKHFDVSDCHTHVCDCYKEK